MWGWRIRSPICSSTGRSCHEARCEEHSPTKVPTYRSMPNSLAHRAHELLWNEAARHLWLISMLRRWALEHSKTTGRVTLLYPPADDPGLERVYGNSILQDVRMPWRGMRC